MAVELKKLYSDIYPSHDVRLLTQGCFHRYIGWVHMVENIDFIPLLHGDELVFNSSLNYESDEHRIQFIEKLISHDAGGLIVALQEGNDFSEELIAYCNQNNFPLFRAGWETSYLNIMRRFSEILLSNERNETNLVSALKNALYYPANIDSYLKHFERNDFLQEMPYVITVIGNTANNDTALLPSMLRHKYEQCIIYEDLNNMILLTVGYSPEHLKKDFTSVCQKYPFLEVGIGSLELNLTNLHLSYEHAMNAYQITSANILSTPLCYDELGSYQILCNLKDTDKVCHNFVKQTLGKLMEYDKENGSSYMEVLKNFFQNDCSIVQTADATFFHPNTLKYKVKNIKEILGYDIMSNENRTKIMLSLYILNLSNIYSDA